MGHQVIVLFCSLLYGGAEALDQLRRSLAVMKKKTPEGYVATAGAAASLLSVAQGLLGQF